MRNFGKIILNLDHPREFRQGNSCRSTRSFILGVQILPFQPRQEVLAYCTSTSRQATGNRERRANPMYGGRFLWEEIGLLFKPLDRAFSKEQQGPYVAVYLQQRDKKEHRRTCIIIGDRAKTLF